MDIRRIKQFLALAQHGSFGRAASALRLTQPSLTRAIAALEADLGVKLLDRGPRGAVLTPAGERFLPRARAIVDDYARAIAELDPGRAQERQQVRIGVSPNFLSRLLPDVMAETLRRSPQTNIQVTTATAESLRHQLRSRDIDLALSLTPEFPLTPAAQAADLHTEIIAAEEILPVAAMGDPLTLGPLSMEDASKRVWAVPHQMSLLYRFEGAFDRCKLPVPVQGFNGASLELAQRLILNAGLLGMLPISFAALGVEQGRLRLVDCPPLTFSYNVALVRRRTEKSAACLDMAAALGMTAEKPIARAVTSSGITPPLSRRKGGN